MTDWYALRRRFVEQGERLRDIAADSGVAYSTVAAHAKREDWRGQRSAWRDRTRDCEIVSIRDRLLGRIDRALEEDGIEINDLKTVSGALRELSQIQEGGAEAGRGELTVRFLGEAEEMSR